MISQDYFCKWVSDRLNSNKYNKKFVVHKEFGRLHEAIKCCRKFEYVTNCILDKSPSTLTTAIGQDFQQDEYVLKLFIDKEIVGGEEVDGKIESLNYNQISEILNEFTSMYNGVSFNAEENDKSHTVTVGINGFYGADEAQIGDISDGIWVYGDITFVAFQDGFSSKDFTIEVDDAPLPITEFVITMKETGDAVQKINESSGGFAVKQTTFGIDVILPAQNNTFGEYLFKRVMGMDAPKTKTLKIYKTAPDGKVTGQTCEMVIPTVTLSGKAGVNAGYNVSFMKPLHQAPPVEIDGYKIVLSDDFNGRNYRIIDNDGKVYKNGDVTLVGKTMTLIVMGCLMVVGGISLVNTFSFGVDKQDMQVVKEIKVVDGDSITIEQNPYVNKDNIRFTVVESDYRVAGANAEFMGAVGEKLRFEADDETLAIRTSIGNFSVGDEFVVDNRQITVFGRINSYIWEASPGSDIGRGRIKLEIADKDGNFRPLNNGDRFYDYDILKVYVDSSSEWADMEFYYNGFKKEVEIVVDGYTTFELSMMELFHKTILNENMPKPPLMLSDLEIYRRNCHLEIIGVEDFNHMILNVGDFIVDGDDIEVTRKDGGKLYYVNEFGQADIVETAEMSPFLVFANQLQGLSKCFDIVIGEGLIGLDRSYKFESSIRGDVILDADAVAIDGEELTVRYIGAPSSQTWGLTIDGAEIEDGTSFTVTQNVHITGIFVRGNITMPDPTFRS